MKSRVPTEVRRYVERWYERKKAVGTTKHLAKRLDLPYVTVANLVQSIRKQSL